MIAASDTGPGILNRKSRQITEKHMRQHAVVVGHVLLIDGPQIRYQKSAAQCWLMLKLRPLRRQLTIFSTLALVHSGKLTVSRLLPGSRSTPRRTSR